MDHPSEMSEISITCHSRDQAEHLHVLLESVLRIGGVDELYVVDHLSDDNSRQLVEQFQPEFAQRDISLRYNFEDRELSSDFTFADLRDATIAACRKKAVCLLDADFVIGEAFKHYLRDALAAMQNDARIYSVAFPVPILYDDVQVDKDGRVLGFGSCSLHKPMPRIFIRGAVQFRQDARGGRHEKAYPIIPEKDQVAVLAYRPNALISLNILSRKRRLYRDQSWENYFEMLAAGVELPPYRQAVHEGKVRSGVSSLDSHHSAYRGEFSVLGERFYLSPKAVQRLVRPEIPSRDDHTQRISPIRAGKINPSG